jgi:hypothetical protein
MALAELVRTRSNRTNVYELPSGDQIVVGRVGSPDLSGRLVCVVLQVQRDVLFAAPAQDIDMPRRTLVAIERWHLLEQQLTP